MLKALIRLERAANHPGICVIFAGRTKEALAQVPYHEVASLLGHREVAYYQARIEPNGPIHLGEEVPEDQVP